MTGETTQPGVFTIIDI